ncbi:MAG TPA: response regulator transcription factor [Gaiellales bacterium]|jgi:two-component system response regulator MprA|nr:response regulator transcription factor [Gaiellales bacterium]
MRYSLLLAEDDAGLRDLLVRGLREEDFAVEAVATGSELLRAFDARGADLLILDIGLPDADGRDVCATLRARGEAVPIVFLTASDAVPERIAGFEAGGDDYLTKPFVLAELAERVRALVRRSAQRPGIEVGGLRLDSVTHAALMGDASATLTPIEFRLLSTLLNRPGEVVRRRSLAAAGWPDGSAVLDNTLDACVSRLRRKLAAIGAELTIDTVHGVGYRVADSG